jgi:O-antigen/teichoic acid export membrane protein
MRDSWRLVALTSAAKVYWVVATLVTTMITARYLGPSGRGILVAAMSWVIAFATLGNLSLSQVIVYVATGKAKEEWLPSSVGSLGLILAGTTILGVIVATGIYFFSEGRAFQHIAPRTIVLAFLAFPLMILVEYGNGLLMSLGRLHVLNLAQTIGATAAIILTFLAVGPLRWSIDGAVSAFVIAQLIIASIAWWDIVHHAGSVTSSGERVRELLSGAVRLHMNAVGTYLFTQANVLILNYFRSPSETAWFQLATQLAAGIQIVPLAVSMVAYSLVAKHGPDAAWPQQRKLLLEVLGVVMVLGVIAYFVAPYFVPLLFGASFAQSVPVFRILLYAVVGMTMSVVMASQWIARGLFVQAAAITLFVGAATVAGNYFVVPRYGMTGAAWVTVGTYCISIAGNGAMAIWVEIRTRRGVHV